MKKKRNINEKIDYKSRFEPNLNYRCAQDTFSFTQNFSIFHTRWRSRRKSLKPIKLFNYRDKFTLNWIEKKKTTKIIKWKLTFMNLIAFVRNNTKKATSSNRSKNEMNEWMTISRRATTIQHESIDGEQPIDRCMCEPVWVRSKRNRLKSLNGGWFACQRLPAICISVYTFDLKFQCEYIYLYP